MQAQTPAVGIAQFNDYPAYRRYIIPCTCGCESKIELSLEIDTEPPKGDLITCHISSTVKTAYWRETFPVTYNESFLIQGAKQIANDVIRRMQICWNALVHGYVEMESYTLLSQQQALNLSVTIVAVIKELENGKTTDV